MVLCCDFLKKKFFWGQLASPTILTKFTLLTNFQRSKITLTTSFCLKCSTDKSRPKRNICSHTALFNVGSILRSFLPMASSRLLLLLCLASLAAAAPESALVTSIPGFDGAFPSKHYAGYVTSFISSCLLAFGSRTDVLDLGVFLQAMWPSMRITARTCSTTLWSPRGTPPRTPSSSGSTEVPAAPASTGLSTSTASTSSQSTA